MPIIFLKYVFFLKWTYRLRWRIMRYLDRFTKISESFNVWVASGNNLHNPHFNRSTERETERRKNTTAESKLYLWVFVFRVKGDVRTHLRSAVVEYAVNYSLAGVRGIPYDSRTEKVRPVK